LNRVKIDNENHIYKNRKENFDNIRFYISDVEFDNVILQDHAQIDNEMNKNKIHEQNNYDIIQFYI
jgi:hypothetical protein